MQNNLTCENTVLHKTATVICCQHYLIPCCIDRPLKTTHSHSLLIVAVSLKWAGYMFILHDLCLLELDSSSMVNKILTRKDQILQNAMKVNWNRAEKRVIEEKVFYSCSLSLY